MQLQGRVNPLCVVADDSIFLTLLAANLSKNSHVISLFPGLRDKGAQYLENVAKENGLSMDRVEVPEKRKACLTIHDTHGKKVILVLLLLYLACQQHLLVEYSSSSIYKKKDITLLFMCSFKPLFFFFLLFLEQEKERSKS